MQEKIMYKLIGRRISLARDLKGLTQEQLAEKCHLSVSTISRTETGVTAPPLDTLSRICEQLDVSLDFVLYDILSENSSPVHPLIKEAITILELLDDRHKLFFLDVLKSYINRLS